MPTPVQRPKPTRYRQVQPWFVSSTPFAKRSSKKRDAAICAARVHLFAPELFLHSVERGGRAALEGARVQEDHGKGKSRKKEREGRSAGESMSFGQWTTRLVGEGR